MGLETLSPYYQPGYINNNSPDKREQVTAKVRRIFKKTIPLPF